MPIFPTTCHRHARSATHVSRWKMGRSNDRRGLSRLEIITLVLIAGAGLTILLPLLSRSKNSARTVQCDLKQQELARTIAFVSQLENALPGYSNWQADTASGERVKTGWVFKLLPYLNRPIDPVTLQPPGPDQLGPRAPIYQKYGPTADAASRGQVPDNFLSEVVCPADNRLASSRRASILSFVGNAGLPDNFPAEDAATSPLPDGIESGVMLERFRAWDKPYQITLDEIEAADGAEFTLLLSENVDAGLWTDASEAKVGFLWSVNDGSNREAIAQVADGDKLDDTTKELLRAIPAVLPINVDRGKSDGTVRFARLSSWHGKGATVTYCDGHTRWIDEDIDPRILVRQMTPMGSKVCFPATSTLMPEPWREVQQ